MPAVALVLVASCSDDGKPADVRPKTEGPIQIVPSDAGVTTSAVGNGRTGGESHDVEVPRPIMPQPGSRDRRPIDVTLRSSPPGASVAVDGTAVGVTPAFWNGIADGREHEFVFSLPRHAIARYRFVPVTSGVLHARLDPMAEERDAGVVPPPEVVPHPEPSAVAPPPAPPTLGPPTDAAAAPIPTGSAAPSPTPPGSTAPSTGSATAPSPGSGHGPQP